jgi:hypothetical protein
MTFTVEEISLLLEVNHSSRKVAIMALIDLITITEDAELRGMLHCPSGKLYSMSDKEFEAVDFDS